MLHAGSQTDSLQITISLFSSTEPLILFGQLHSTHCFYHWFPIFPSNSPAELVTSVFLFLLDSNLVTVIFLFIFWFAPLSKSFCIYFYHPQNSQIHLLIPFYSFVPLLQLFSTDPLFFFSPTSEHTNNLWTECSKVFSWKYYIIYFPYWDLMPKMNIFTTLD